MITWHDVWVGGLDGAKIILAFFLASCIVIGVLCVAYFVSTGLIWLGIWGVNTIRNAWKNPNLKKGKSNA